MRKTVAPHPLSDRPAGQPDPARLAWLGSAALALLRVAPAFSIWGQTRRGAFLAAQGAAPGQPEVLFLSAETWRGPLTVNLAPGQQAALAGLAVGARLDAGPDGLRRDGRLLFQTEGTPLWQPHPPALAHGEQGDPAEAESRRMAWMARRLLDEPQAAPLSGWLEDLANGRSAGALGPACWTALLGRGPGLTPAGDDALLGMLLALSRYGDHTANGPARQPEAAGDGNLAAEPPAFCRQVAAAAIQRTSALSAALLLCAAQGQADERLLLALDWLRGRNGLEAEAAARLLLAWGASSGAAAFVGMAEGSKELTFGRSAWFASGR
jgi:hypothetical protein